MHDIVGQFWVELGSVYHDAINKRSFCANGKVSPLYLVSDRGRGIGARAGGGMCLDYYRSIPLVSFHRREAEPPI